MTKGVICALILAAFKQIARVFAQTMCIYAD